MIFLIFYACLFNKTGLPFDWWPRFNLFSLYIFLKIGYLSFDFYCCDKQPDEIHVDQERVSLVYRLQPIIRGSQGRSFRQEAKTGTQLREGTQGRAWKQEWKQRPQRNSAYWLPPHVIVNLCFHTTKVHLPKDSITHSGLGTLHQLLIKKIPNLIINK